MRSALVIARATYGETIRTGIYVILLLVFAFLIYASRFITQFGFYQEMNIVREMGVASISVWGFLIATILSTMIVTAELENRTAIGLLTKPIGRGDFLLGKFLGLMFAVVVGIVFLAFVLLYTLWEYSGVVLLERHYTDMFCAGKTGGIGEFLWENFFAVNGMLTLDAILLATLQTTVVAAIAVSIALFFPAPVTIGAMALAFIVGNLSTYMVSAISSMNSGIMNALASFLYYAAPNLGNFNLQNAFSEGKVISLAYISYSALYVVIYSATVLFVAARLFQRRDIT